MKSMLRIFKFNRLWYCIYSLVIKYYTKKIVTAIQAKKLKSFLGATGSYDTQYLNIIQQVLKPTRKTQHSK